MYYLWILGSFLFLCFSLNAQFQDDERLLFWEKQEKKMEKSWEKEESELEDMTDRFRLPGQIKPPAKKEKQSPPSIVKQEQSSPLPEEYEGELLEDWSFPELLEDRIERFFGFLNFYVLFKEIQKKISKQEKIFKMKTIPQEGQKQESIESNKEEEEIPSLDRFLLPGEMQAESSEPEEEVDFGRFSLEEDSEDLSEEIELDENTPKEIAVDDAFLVVLSPSFFIKNDEPESNQLPVDSIPQDKKQDLPALEYVESEAKHKVEKEKEIFIPQESLIERQESIDHEEINPLSMKLVFQQTHLSHDKQNLFNPDNQLGLLGDYHRILLTTLFHYSFYDNKDVANPVSMGIELKNTFVYRDKTSEIANRNWENYLQEIFIYFRYNRLGIRIGKENVQPGTGGGYAWNPTDIFAHSSTIYHETEGNFDQRGIRPGLYGITLNYAMDFADFALGYSPSLAKNKRYFYQLYSNPSFQEKSFSTSRNDTEFQDNNANIVFARFTWRNLFEGTQALILQAGNHITPSAPEFFFSYADHQYEYIMTDQGIQKIYEKESQYNLGMVWSLGIGDSLLFRMEMNYSNQTDGLSLKKIADTPELFSLERKHGDNFEISFAMAYTFWKITWDMEYYYQSNGLSNQERKDFFDSIQLMKELRDSSPFGLGEYYGGLLKSTRNFMNSTQTGSHYLFQQISHSLFFSEKKRELLIRLRNTSSLQDFSGNLSLKLHYKFFTYSECELSTSYFYGGEKTIFGSTPYSWVIAGSLQILF